MTHFKARPRKAQRKLLQKLNLKSEHELNAAKEILNVIIILIFTLLSEAFSRIKFVAKSVL